MKEYIYKFADGTKSVVAVEDKLFEVFERLGSSGEIRQSKGNKAACIVGRAMG